MDLPILIFWSGSILRSEIDILKESKYYKSKNVLASRSLKFLAPFLKGYLNKRRNASYSCYKCGLVCVYVYN